MRAMFVFDVCVQSRIGKVRFAAFADEVSS